MIRTRAVLGALLACVAIAGCRRDRTAQGAIADSTFIATLSELRRAETDTTLDQTMRDSTRRMILRRHRVTSTQLELAARSLASSPARASEIWRRIESPTSAAPGRPGAPPPPPLTSHPVPRH